MPEIDPFVDLVDANHILYNEGVVDGLGHVSFRDPGDPGTFWLSQAIAPALVTREDLIQYALDGTPVDGGQHNNYLERFIHGEIYKVRPEVNSVVHSHSESAIVFGVTGAPLEALTHMHAFLDEIPNFEIRTVPSNVPGNLLVDTNPLGAALAETLGDRPVALMRGHGMVAVGTTIREAVYRAIYTVQNARLQSEAYRLNRPITFLNADEKAFCTAMSTRSGYTRAWNLWRREAERALS